MFKVNMEMESEPFIKELYSVMNELVTKIAEERKQENELPFLLSRTQLAKHIFNVSVQTLESHILYRTDFPKIHVGDRVLYPRDLVKEWIHNNLDKVVDMTPNRLKLVKK